jgi:hypothetical protein
MAADKNTRDEETIARLRELAEQQIKAEEDTLTRLKELGEQQIKAEEEALERLKREREQRRIVGGRTWDEETRDRLKNAVEQQNRLEAELARVVDYRKALERSLELDRQLRGVTGGGGKVLDPESLKEKSIRKALFDIAAANNGLVIAASATQILLDAGVSNDREHIRGLIYSTIYHNKRFFKKERPGYYRVVTNVDNPLQNST